MKQYKGLIIVCIIGLCVFGGYFGLHLNKVDAITPISMETAVTQASGTKPSITISTSSSVNKGDYFTVNILVNPAGQNIAGAQFNLTFNPTLVSVNAITDGDLFGTNQIFINGKIDNIAGTITNVTDVTPTFISSQGIMVSISMTADNIGVCNLSLSNVIIGNQQGKAVNSIINNASITIN